jgi:hypothetical protein
MGYWSKHTAKRIQMNFAITGEHNAHEKAIIHSVVELMRIDNVATHVKQKATYSRNKPKTVITL